MKKIMITIVAALAFAACGCEDCQSKIEVGAYVSPYYLQGRIIGAEIRTEIPPRDWIWTAGAVEVNGVHLHVASTGAYSGYVLVLYADQPSADESAALAEWQDHAPVYIMPGAP